MYGYASKGRQCVIAYNKRQDWNTKSNCYAVDTLSMHAPVCLIVMRLNYGSETLGSDIPKKLMTQYVSIY